MNENNKYWEFDGVKYDFCKGTQLFMYAVKNNNINIVRKLINDVDVNSITVNKFTPLMIASFNNYFKIVELLILHGADINLQNCKGLTALMLAIVNNNDKIAKILIPKSNLSIKNNYGYTAYIYSTGELSKLIKKSGYKELNKISKIDMLCATSDIIMDLLKNSGVKTN